jgi:hypothetical protein
MAAGHEGAGPEMSLGVDIRLPFESVSHPELAAEGRLVEMKYFFTRKLMLMKESAAFAVLPGGFGTLDECFELLTLLQTGKAEPAPIVLVDIPIGKPGRPSSAVRSCVAGLRARETRPSTGSPTTFPSPSRRSSASTATTSHGASWLRRW